MIASIIIPTYNKPRYLDFTLASFVNQSCPEFEVVVVNDGGDGAAGEVVGRYQDALKITYLTQPNAGRSVARNTGIEAASGEVLIFNDDDRIVHPDFVREHVAAQRDRDDVAVIGWKRRALTIWQRGRLPMIESDYLALLANVPHLAARLPTEDFDLIEPEQLVTDYPRAIAVAGLGDDQDNYDSIIDRYSPNLDGFRLDWALGTAANLSVRRQHVLDIGGFDKDYAGWGMEDTDLSYRLHRLGVRFVVNRTAWNYHQVHPIGTDSIRRDQGRRVTQLMANLRLFCQKHRTVEAYLYWRKWTFAIDLEQASDLLGVLDEHPYLEHELVRLYASEL